MREWRSRFVLWCLLCALLQGCFWTPRSSLPKSQIAWADSAPHGRALKAWWKSFDDPVLDRVIDRALAGNLELQEAAARLRQAEAEASREGALLFPTVDVAGDLGATRVDEGRRRAAGLGALLRWEIDLWGRLRAGRRAATEEVGAAAMDLRAAKVVLCAAVAEVYFSILEDQMQLELLERQRETNQTLLELTQLRLGQGVASAVDVLQQKEQLTSTLARVPLVQATLESDRKRLLILMGEHPGESGSAAMQTPGETTELPEGNRDSAADFTAFDLLQRPDLAALQHRIKSMDQRVAQAVADRLPNVAISASTTLTDASDLNALISSAVGELVLPVIDGGARRAEVQRRRAALEELLLEYGQAYLEAAAELQIALINEDRQQRHVDLLREQLAVAQRVLFESRNRYAQGLTDYLPVLDALDRVQELERSLITNRRLRLSYRVQRHRALGGH